MDEKVGVYRKENVLIGGATHRPSDHVVVPVLRERFVETLENEWSGYHLQWNVQQRFMRNL